MTTLKHLISSQGAQLLGYLNLENTTYFEKGWKQIELEYDKNIHVSAYSLFF